MTLRRTLKRSLSTTTRGLLQFGSGGVAPSYDTDAQAYITLVEAADSQSLETGVKDAINAFVVGCKSDGIWDAIKAACIMAGARTLDGALVPLVGTAPTNNNFVSGDYNRKTGLVGDGATKYLDSNRNNNADPQNDNHQAVWVSSAQTGLFGIHIGAGASVDVGVTQFGENPGTGEFVLRQRSNASVVIASASGTTDFIGHSRGSASVFSYRLGGASTNSNTSSQTSYSGNVFIFCRNASGPQAFFDGRLSFYSIGEALDLALLDSRVSTLMTAIGAAIP